MKHLLLTTIAALLVVGCGEPNPEADSALLDAAFFGDIAAAKLQIAAGADIDAPNSIGNTSLHIVVQNYGNKEFVEFLIAEGANLNLKNRLDKTPLDWAIQFRRKEIAVLLHKHGAKTAEDRLHSWLRKQLKAEGK